MGLLYIPGAPDATRKTPFSQNFRLCRLPKSPPRGKLSLAFFREVYYTISTCRCDGMVDVVDSKTSSPSVAGVGKSLRQSSVFQIRFFICLSHPSCVSLQIPGNACPGVKKYICRCVGIGRRGGLKIRWANNSCGFDPRHRHHICSEVLCFGAFFTAQKQNIEHFSETPEELHLQTRPYWKNPNVCRYWMWC